MCVHVYTCVCAMGVCGCVYACVCDGGVWLCVCVFVCVCVYGGGVCPYVRPNSPPESPCLSTGTTGVDCLGYTYRPATGRLLANEPWPGKFDKGVSICATKQPTREPLPTALALRVKTAWDTHIDQPRAMWWLKSLGPGSSMHEFCRWFAHSVCPPSHTMHPLHTPNA